MVLQFILNLVIYCFLNNVFQFQRGSSQKLFKGVQKIKQFQLTQNFYLKKPFFLILYALWPLTRFIFYLPLFLVTLFFCQELNCLKCVGGRVQDYLELLFFKLLKKQLIFGSRVNFLRLEINFKLQKQGKNQRFFFLRVDSVAKQLCAKKLDGMVVGSNCNYLMLNITNQIQQFQKSMQNAYDIT
eukprot:TRINITY_DN10329_c0_g1_i14.p2 TRINITY_DN10329_c0_g1~~TRINITY_DN10329_c0_g1_i14.p2  ORF type:complete len:185 (-),score=6.89 TRINITY_DN10329_c0_g1_i14:40-594(-)